MISITENMYFWEYKKVSAWAFKSRDFEFVFLWSENEVMNVKWYWIVLSDIKSSRKYWMLLIDTE